MDCRIAKRLIHSAVDDELNETLKNKLQSHLDICASCATLLDSERTDAARLHSMLNLSTEGFLLPMDFAAATALKAAREASRPGVLEWITNGLASLLASRRIVGTAAGLALVVVTALISITADHILDSSPVVAPRVTSGHLVAFTVHPKPNGVDAGVDAHRYCKVSKTTEETLR